MEGTEKTNLHGVPLAVQTGLDHRGGFGPDVVPLFPPAGTFAALGGREAVARLVTGLYDRIEADPVLRPAFNHDLTGERERQKLFFEAWFGGAPTYFDAAWRRGLNARHEKITISRGMAERWVAHFLDSLGEAATDPGIVDCVRPIITGLAMALVNRADEPVRGQRLRDSCSIADLLPFLQHVARDDAPGIVASVAGFPKVLAHQGPMLLLTAAVRGKVRAAEALLDAGVNVNAPAMLSGSEANLHGLPSLLHLTPLCGALARRRDTVVRLLVERGARYDIFTAACIGDEDAVREMLNRAPELADARDPAGDVAPVTPLMHAVFAGQARVARLLLQRGATVGANSVRLITAAANAGNELLADLLLEYGADPSAMGAGAWVLYPALADRLRARGANVNQEPGAWIGMCCTGNSGHTENAPFARALLRCGADVAARYKGRTALHCAAKAGFAHVAEALIAHGGDVNARDEEGRTPLDAAAEAGHSIDTEPVRRLLIGHRARSGTG
jgi:truncated hemoglobin YjbI/ankyrin repeat protein